MAMPCPRHDDQQSRINAAGVGGMEARTEQEAILLTPMPDPSKLKVGDRVRFISLPEEWSRPGYRTPRESAGFMKTMIRRGYSSRIFKIEHGGPWIAARLRRRGRWEHHTWGIF